MVLRLKLTANLIQYFLKNFFKQIDDVNIVLDDGGQTYERQIVITHVWIPNIKNGILLIVEDTHTSNFKSFDYPTKYSFIKLDNAQIDNINSGFPEGNVSNLSNKNKVFSISIFESTVNFKISRQAHC